MATDFQDSGMKLADLKRAMARYCNRPRYLKALRAGVPRIDLQGQPVGVVTPEEVAEAQIHLATWKAQHGIRLRLHAHLNLFSPRMTLRCQRSISCLVVWN